MEVENDKIYTLLNISEQRVMQPGEYPPGCSFIVFGVRDNQPVPSDILLN